MESLRVKSAGAVESSRLSGLLIAALRVGIALMWIQNVAWKLPPDFGAKTNSGLYFWAHQAVTHPVFAPFSTFVSAVYLPNSVFFGWITLLTEAALGAFLLIGLATRFWRSSEWPSRSRSRCRR